MAIKAEVAPITEASEIAVKMTMLTGEAWLNSSQNTNKGFFRGMVSENPKAESNTFLVLKHEATEYKDCANENISVYNGGNLVGFIGYRDEHGDLLSAKQFVEDLQKLEVESLHARRDSEVCALFE